MFCVRASRFETHHQIGGFKRKIEKSLITLWRRFISEFLSSILNSIYLWVSNQPSGAWKSLWFFVCMCFPDSKKLITRKKSPEVKHVPSRARRQLAESRQGSTMTPHSTSAMCQRGRWWCAWHRWWVQRFTALSNNTSILETQLKRRRGDSCPISFSGFGELVTISNPEILGLDVYM